MPQHSDTIILQIGSLLSIREDNGPSSGADMSGLEGLDDAWLLIRDGRIHSFGTMDETIPIPPSARVIDARGGYVLPAWCDSHTHLVYQGSRELEFVDRIRGLSYEEIARRGGGILNSAERLRNASEEELFVQAWQRLLEIISYGTGAVEIKSGYGLSFESELKMLRVIRRIRDLSPIPVKATFLGAHALPARYTNDREAYIREITDRMIPRIADEGLADYCDVFCETGFFTVEETDRILSAAGRYGLKPKIHANELDYSGGIQVGVRHGAISVDHLECTGDEEIEALLGSDTMPTLLPGTAFFLGLDYPPARKMIEAGLPLALASDYNPGSTPSGRMPFVLSLACVKMKMLPAEAINAATINGACAMELQHELGSISRGKLANLIITDPLPSLAFLPYAYGTDWISEVMIQGEPWSGIGYAYGAVQS